jgi:hypothetical protein
MLVSMDDSLVTVLGLSARVVRLWGNGVGCGVSGHLIASETAPTGAFFAFRVGADRQGQGLR